MKPHRLFLPLFLAVALLHAQFSFGADEKTDAGPAPTPEEKQAAETLSKRGVLVQTLAAGVNWSYVNFRGIEKPDAAAFALIGKIPSIVELDLSGVQFQPADLAGVATLKNLKKLNLSRSNANDAGLVHVKGLAQLESLNLFHTDVTDAGLQQLIGLKNLKRLYIFETKVTDAGAAALAKAAPALWRHPRPGGFQNTKRSISGRIRAHAGSPKRTHPATERERAQAPARRRAGACAGARNPRFGVPRTR